MYYQNIAGCCRNDAVGFHGHGSVRRRVGEREMSEGKDKKLFAVAAVIAPVRTSSR